MSDRPAACPKVQGLLDFVGATIPDAIVSIAQQLTLLFSRNLFNQALAGDTSAIDQITSKVIARGWIDKKSDPSIVVDGVLEWVALARTV